MIEKLLTLVRYSPIYPHWLNFLNARKANNELLKYYKGRVLETGAGNCKNKEAVLASCPKVKEYTATDYNSWDGAFKKQSQEIGKFGVISRVLYGASKDGSKLDKVCSALDLPFKNSTFDTYCSLEVIEHIDDLRKFFSEAYRVLKPGGNCIITSPFLFRDHGGIDQDFQRLTMGGYHYIASISGFKVKLLITKSYLGTTLSILINQFIIRRILEGNILEKIIFSVVMIPIFITTNLFGFVLDLVYPDIRFASRYHVVMTK